MIKNRERRWAAVLAAIGVVCALAAVLVVIGSASEGPDHQVVWSACPEDVTAAAAPTRRAARSTP